MKYNTATMIIMGTILILNCDLFNYFKFSEPIKKDELYGFYIANYKDIFDYIELRSDTTYIHYAIFPDGRVRSDTGYWRYMSSSFNIIPHISSKYGGKGYWSFVSDCEDNELTLYEFQQTPYTIPGYGELTQIPGTKEKHSWCSCLFKKRGVIKIKLGISSSLYYP